MAPSIAQRIGMSWRSTAIDHFLHWLAGHRGLGRAPSAEGAVCGDGGEPLMHAEASSSLGYRRQPRDDRGTRRLERENGTEVARSEIVGSGLPPPTLPEVGVTSASPRTHASATIDHRRARWLIGLAALAVTVVLVFAAILATRNSTERSAASTWGPSGFEALRSQPDERWTIAFDGNVHDAIIAGRAILFAVTEPAGSFVASYDLETGAEQWRSTMTDAAYSTIDARDSGTVVALSPNQVGGSAVRILDIADGTELRAFALRNEYAFREHLMFPGLLTATDIEDGVEFAVLSDDGVLTAQARGHVAGFDQRHLVLLDGGKLTVYDLATLEKVGASVTVDDVEDASGSVVHGRLLVGDLDRLIAYSMDGVELWSISSSVGSVVWAGAVGDDHVLVDGRDGISLVSVSDSSGEEVWAIDDGREPYSIFESDGNRFVLAYDEAWFGLAGPTVGSSGSVAAATLSSPTLFVIELDGDQPRERTSAPTVGRDDGDIEVWSDVVYVTRIDGNITTLEAVLLPDLSSSWELTVGDEIRDGGFEILSGAIVGVERTEDRTTVTLYKLTP